MLPWSQLPTYVFVAIFVLVVVFVAVPAREGVVRTGKRDYMEAVHVAANGNRASRGDDTPSAAGHKVAFLAAHAVHLCEGLP